MSKKAPQQGNIWRQQSQSSNDTGPILLGGTTPTAQTAPQVGVVNIPQQFQNRIDTSTANTLQTAFNQVSREVEPAVVNLRVYKTEPLVNGGNTNGTIHFDNPFDKIIHEFIPDKGMQTVIEGYGSGVIVEPSGYILTNNHLVETASEIKVTTFAQNNVSYEARIIRTDTTADLALLKLEATGEQFPIVELGDSAAVRVGDLVLAVGSPFKLEHTVTQGMIGAVDRNITIGNIEYKNLIQSDAPLNKGNSGGPLVNLNAEVIGINTAIYSSVEGFTGISFAIPINRASDLLKGIIDVTQNVKWNQNSNGQGNSIGQTQRSAPTVMQGIPAQAPVAHTNSGQAHGQIGQTQRSAPANTGQTLPWFGISVADAKTAGVLITSVGASSYAQQWGLMPGDIIIRINKWRIYNTEQMWRVVNDLDSEEKNHIIIRRNNRKQRVRMEF